MRIRKKLPSELLFYSRRAIKKKWQLTYTLYVVRVKVPVPNSKRQRLFYMMDEIIDVFHKWKDKQQRKRAFHNESSNVKSIYFALTNSKAISQPVLNFNFFLRETKKNIFPPFRTPICTQITIKTVHFLTPLA